MLICMDGPAGSGKSTVAKRLAKRLDFQYLDTGALYRSVGYLARRDGLDFRNEDALGTLAETMDVRFLPDEPTQKVMVNGEDVTEAIRSPQAGNDASIVAALPAVRRALLGLQRRIGKQRSTVVEGRDTGSVVFPDAEVKVYLEAKAEERARRRMKDFEAQGQTADFTEVLHDIEERDRRDQERSEAPLTVAQGAIRLDTTGLSIDEVVDRLVTLSEEHRHV